MDHVRKLKGQKMIMTVWGLNVTACALLCDQKSYKRAFFRLPLLLIKHNVPSAVAHRWKWMWWRKTRCLWCPFGGGKVPLCLAERLLFVSKSVALHTSEVRHWCVVRHSLWVVSSAIHSMFDGTNICLASLDHSKIIFHICRGPAVTWIQFCTWSSARQARYF